MKNLILKNFSTCLILTFIFIHLACPEPPDNKPQKADCPVGQSPCEDDSTACCWDTTSHNFTWEIDTLGISGSLRDVQIIDENNIWVVGEIETDSGKYGAAQWNGDYWELKKLKGPGISVQTITPRGLWYFSEDNIWFASGSIYHWNGTETSMLWQRNINSDETVEKIWALSENDIYFVGRGGTIVHYGGSSFTKMASPTTQDLDGIVGVVDSETGEKRIWVKGWGGYPYRGFLMQYDGTDWEIVWDENNPFFEDSQYIEPTLHIPDEKYLVIYSGGQDNSILSIHEQEDLQQYEILHYDYHGFIRSLAGDKVNDLIGVGDLTNAIHFNGSTVVQIDELENMVPAFRYLAVDSKGGIIVIVSDTPYVIRGRKLE
ncbi:MAG: hypothetical protein QF794_00400 [Candidatus Marinimicrobia bacterium]|nr:hypothetical protein [Candidatus Neomarinimicrobiota bacterium]